MLDRQCQRSWVEHLDHPVPHMMSSESDSMPPLVGGTPPGTLQIGQLEGGSYSLRVPSLQPRGGPLNNAQPRVARGIHCHPHQIRDGADSDGYSTVSKAPSSHRCRRKQCGEKQLAPVCLDILIF